MSAGRGRTEQNIYFSKANEARLIFTNEVNQAIGDLSIVGMYTLYSIREKIEPVLLLDILSYKYSALYLMRGGSLAILGKTLVRVWCDCTHSTQ